MPPSNFLSPWNGLYFMELTTRTHTTSKHHRLLLKLLVTIHNLTIRIYFWRYHLIYVIKYGEVKMVATRSHNYTDYHWWCSKVLFILQEQENSHQYHSAASPVVYSSNVPVKYAGASVAQYYGSHQTISDCLEGPLREMKPRPDTAKLALNLRLGK